MLWRTGLKVGTRYTLLEKILHFNNRVSYGEVGLGFYPSLQEPHIHNISPISLHINLHIPCKSKWTYLVYYTPHFPIWGWAGPSREFELLDYRGSSIALGMPAQYVVSLHPAIKYIFWSWRVIYLGWSLQLLAQLRSHLFKMEYYGGVGYFGENFWSGYKCK